MSVHKIDTTTLQELILREPLAVAERLFQGAGSDRLKLVLKFLKRSAQSARVGETTVLTVFSLMRPDDVVDEHRRNSASPVRHGTTLTGEIDAIIIEIREDGSAFLWKDVPAELQGKIEQGIVYRLVQGVESFVVQGASISVPKVIECTVSQFFLQYFTDLKEALLFYRDSMARTSKCHLLRLAWYDERRFWFHSGPEFRLRRSLCNFLIAFLRSDEIELRPEQNVDESHPVDIKVTWRMENRIAIIEVKWLGKSRDTETHEITAEYFDQRARDGAKQLAEYLEAHRQESPFGDTRGYLVVFDCRRKLLNPDTKTLSKENGLHYATRDVEYAPAYHVERDDFEEPIRLFLEPVCL